jgi:hypothetical protein
MSRARIATRKTYWFEAATVAVGVATGAAFAPLGAEAVFSVVALTAAALSVGACRNCRKIAAY